MTLNPHVKLVVSLKCRQSTDKEEVLIVSLVLNSSKNVILFSGDTAATYKFTDISSEYDTLFDKCYATKIDELYVGRNLTPYTE